MDAGLEITEDWRVRVRNLAEDLLLNLGFELVDLEFGQGEDNSLLRLYIDQEGGITLEDCTHVSRMLGALLDVEDPIPGRYTLEVSSPGLNRRLSRAKDFQTRLGETVKLTLLKPLDGRRRFKGVLLACQEDPLTLSIEIDGETFIVPLDKTSKCNLVYNFTK
ncbi:MAG: ribosome maturation factor RimP [Deltaproteobacteria bacterium]|nr:MAG: ribosome maturation factor RimP [Deltaproteobacteria bacterium]